ncbi:MAG: hypothetical protein KAX49_03245 [Halanaerobiales bacterium]|nr:hypothetical protein [Halanaerobiales bacterium]
MKQGIALCFLNMGADQDLRTIENFEEAYRSRWEDFKVLKKGNRKILCMHLGGVLIECLLKSLIVKKYKIKKEKKKQSLWFNDTAFNELVSIDNPTTPIYRGKKTAENPGHKLHKALDQLQELSNNMSYIEQKLKEIANPYPRDCDCSFIDLRYLDEEEVTDTEFDAWFEDFSDCIRWLNKHKSNIREVQ